MQHYINNLLPLKPVLLSPFVGCVFSLLCNTAQPRYLLSTKLQYSMFCRLQRVLSYRSVNNILLNTYRNSIRRHLLSFWVMCYYTCYVLLTISVMPFCQVVPHTILQAYLLTIAIMGISQLITNYIIQVFAYPIGVSVGTIDEPVENCVLALHRPLTLDLHKKASVKNIRHRSIPC